MGRQLFGDQKLNQPLQIMLFGKLFVFVYWFKWAVYQRDGDFVRVSSKLC